jgi:hypothetical protein
MTATITLVRLSHKRRTVWVNPALVACVMEGENPEYTYIWFSRDIGDHVYVDQKLDQVVALLTREDAREP